MSNWIKGFSLTMLIKPFFSVDSFLETALLRQREVWLRKGTKNDAMHGQGFPHFKGSISEHFHSCILNFTNAIKLKTYIYCNLKFTIYIILSKYLGHVSTRAALLKKEKSFCFAFLKKCVYMN